jgi:hypothetical protein
VTIGFGIAVHEVFFLVALIVAIAAFVQSIVNAVGEWIARAKLTHRHL